MNRARPLPALAAAAAHVARRGSGAGPAAAGALWSMEDVVVSGASPSGQVTVSGSISYNGLFGQITEVRVTFTRVDEAAGCDDEVTGSQPAYEDNDLLEGESEPEPPEDPPGPRTREFAVPVSFAPAGVCNGDYTVEVVAVLDGGPDAGAEPEIDDIESPPQEHVDDEGEPVVSAVAAPAAPPRNVTATLATTRAVAVSWQPPEGYGSASGCATTGPADRPDFAGYAVERSISGGAPTVVATITSTPGAANQATCYFDTVAADAPAGNYAYPVYALRDGPGGTTIRSHALSATVAVTPPATTTSTTATAPVGPTPPTGRPSGTGRGGGGGGGASGTVPPVPDEGTFEETLDYPEPGEEAAAIPDDADTFLDFVPSPGPGILKPLAIAEVLAVWAFHLRYLARRADSGF
jgi:hypothetical protein